MMRKIIDTFKLFKSIRNKKTLTKIFNKSIVNLKIIDKIRSLLKCNGET